MKNFIKICFVAVCLFVVSGCGKTQTITDATKAFDDPHFSIQYPTDWILKTRQDFSPEIPKETVVTFSRAEPRDGYRTTVSVINDLVPAGTTSLDYAKANINNALKNVIAFQKIEERDVEISGEKTKLLVFEGKSNLNAKTLKYVQVYLVNGELGYTITGSDLLDIEANDFKILQDLVMGFQLKKS